jgi:hypothetical protein
MKITTTKLRQIIKEEINLMLEYERYVYRREDGELWIKDDDGNDEPAPHLEHEYDHLEAGGQGETIFGTGGGGGRDWGDSYGMAAPRRRRRW